MDEEVSEDDANIDEFADMGVLLAGWSVQAETTVIGSAHNLEIVFQASVRRR